MQVVLVHLQLLSHNSLLKYASQLEITKKFTQTAYFAGSRSLKVISVDIPKKLVTSACYDKQHVCVYLQSFLRWTSQYR